MTFDEFETTFHVGTKLRIPTINREMPCHVVCFNEHERIVVVKHWRRRKFKAWEYSVLDEIMIDIWEHIFEKVK